MYKFFVAQDQIDGENIKICKFGDRCLTTQKEYHARKILFEEGYFDFEKGDFALVIFSL